MQWEGAPKPLLTTQELWRVDGFCGGENQFYLRVAMSQRRAPCSGVYGLHQLGGTDFGVQGEGVSLGGEVWRGEFVQNIKFSKNY